MINPSKAGDNELMNQINKEVNNTANEFIPIPVRIKSEIDSRTPNFPKNKEGTSIVSR